MSKRLTPLRECLVGLAWGFGALLFSVGLPALLVSAQSDATDPYEQGRQTAKEAEALVKDATSVPPETYPAFEPNPKERDYYSAGLGIEEKARDELPKHEIGRDVTNAAYDRPRYVFDSREPEFVREREAMAAGNALTQTYSGCQSLGHNRSDGSWTNASCTADAPDPLPACERERHPVCSADKDCELAMDVATISSDMAWNYRHPTLTLGTIADNYWSGSCGVFDRTTTFTIEDVLTVKEFRLFEVGFDDWQLIEVNGQLISNGPYGGDQQEVIGGGKVQYSATESAPCELATNWHQSRNVDVQPYLKNGSNSIRMKVVVSGKGEGYMRFVVKRYCDCPDTGDDTYTTSCPREVAPPTCRLRDSSCIEGPETRIIDGQPVTRACWRYRDSYQCEDSVREEAACKSLRDAHCEQTDAVCVNTDARSGHCSRFRHDFRCPATAASSDSATLCGSDLYCPGGHCAESDREKAEANPQQMAQALTWLAAAQNTADDFDSTEVSMFKGKDMHCAKTEFGFSDCCSDSGWGTSAGLTSCSDDEKQLGFAREAGRGHYVGNYKSGSFPDERNYENYCVFSSKLSRILQEQGRPQLGIGWGDGKRPDCRALTAEEVGKLDWEKMDLSEFYADAMQKAEDAMRDRESNAAIEERVKERIKQMHGSSGG